MQAALLLYFACVPKQPLMPELIKQLRAASLELLSTAPMQLALEAVDAMLTGNFVAFFRCYSRAGLLLQLVMEARVSEVGCGLGCLLPLLETCACGQCPLPGSTAG